MARGIANAGPAGVPLTLATIREHVANMARGMKVVKDRLTVAFLVNAHGSHSFRPLVISKAKRPHDFRPDYDPEEVCYWHNNAKGWMTSPVSVVFMLRANPVSLPMFRNPPACTYIYMLCPTHPPWQLFTHFMEQLNAAMYTEDRHIVIILDNASSHVLKSEGGTSEDLFAFRTRSLSNIRLVYLPPNTTCFTQPLDQGLIAMAKARYRQHWLRAFIDRWNADRATSCVARFKPSLCDATGITPRDLCALFDIRKPIIKARMECASPPFDMNMTPPPAMPEGATPPAETPGRRGRVLPAWMTAPTPSWVTLAQQAARRQELIDSGVPAVMGGYMAAAEWMRL
ncbi:unnamed protein product [Closterium sp. NIES-54]